MGNALQLGRYPCGLERWRGKRCFFVPLQGNNGDYLIELGAREVFERLGVSIVEQPELADVIIINGGGGFASGYYDHGYSILTSLAQDYPSIPLVLLPSTLLFSEELELFVTVLNERAESVWLYARDRKSFDSLRALPFNDSVSILLDHDMAFYLKGGALFEQWKGCLSEKTLLVVERLDLEQSTLGNPYLNWMTLHHAWFKRKWLRRFTQRAICGKFGQTPFLRDAKSLYGQSRRHRNERLPEKVLYEDISLEVLFDFDYFIDAIASASMVVTTRLHVAILAALFGKQVYLQPSGGSYRKIEHVYEQSLSDLKHVKLLPAVDSVSLQRAHQLVVLRESTMYRNRKSKVGH